MHCSFCGAPLQALTTTCASCGARPVLGERYEIREFIGRGGMGEVFLGHDRRLDMEVAIKRLPPQFASSSELRESLHKEARMLARLSDASIVRLFDLAEFHGGSYLILEYVCGPSVRQLLEAGYRFRATEILHLMRQIAQGLSTAHRSGIIHRDLKPSNLLLALEGPERDAFRQARQLPSSLANARVKIADFGIAKAIADAKLTLTNVFSGTPGYMAPEQFRGELPSPETDVYALGVVTRELAANSDAPPAAHEVIARATALERGARFPTAAAFAQALQHAIEGTPVETREIGSSGRSRAVLFLTVGSLGIPVLAAAAILIYQSFHSPAAKTVAPPQVGRKSERPPDIEWHSLRRISEPPLPVAAAKGRAVLEDLDGPQNPSVRWSMALPFVGAIRISAIGIDGTIYASAFPWGICAIREGKLLWAYKTGSSSPRNMQFDAEGRLWFSTGDGVYCLNQEGKGGRLPPGTKMPSPERDGAYRCYTAGLVIGPGLRTEVDGDCSSETIAQDRRGSGIYIGTDLPMIYALDRAGGKRWDYTPSCSPVRLFSPAPDHVLFTCRNDSIYRVASGREMWQRTADSSLSTGMLVDNSGVLYYGDLGEAGIRHLHALSADGRERWKLGLEGMSASELTLAPNGRLLIAGTGIYSRLICVQ